MTTDAHVRLDQRGLFGRVAEQFYAEVGDVAASVEWDELQVLEHLVIGQVLVEDVIDKVSCDLEAVEVDLVDLFAQFDELFEFGEQLV